MTTAPPELRSGADARPTSPVPTPLPHAARHTAVMALRFAVQADTEQECAEGLRLLQQLGLRPAMLPKQLTDDRWMARAVPDMAKTPAEEPGPGACGVSRRPR